MKRIKKINSKAFTMIELLAVIVILGLLMAIAIPAVNKTLANFRIKYYTQLENSLKSAGKDYISDKRYSKPKELLYTKIIPVEDLVDGDYISKVTDYNKDECAGSYVVVVKTGTKSYEYQACLKCSGDEYETDTSKTEMDLCNEAWKENTNVSSGIDNYKDQMLYVYYGKSQTEILKEVGISYATTKKDAEGNILATATDGKKSEIVYPSNVNELSNANIGDVVTLKYTMPDGESYQRQAMLYRYAKPNIKITYTKGNAATGKAVGATYSSGADEWANELTIEATLQSSDATKYKTNIENAPMQKLQYYNAKEKKWYDFASSTVITNGVKVDLNINFNDKIKLRLVDKDGNKTEATVEYSIKVDTEEPTTTLALTSGTKASGTNIYVTDVVLTMTATDTGGSGIYSYGINTNTNAPSSYSNSYTYTINTDANETYYAHAIDKAGNKNNSTKGTISVNRHKYYTVSYNANGGTGTMADQTVAYGDNFKTRQNTFTKLGYTFTGWKEADGTKWTLTSPGTYESNKTWKWTYTKDITLSAQWTPSTYHIYFGANGGSGAPSAITRTYGSNVTFPSTVPTKTGYTFAGWLYYSDGNYSSTATTTATNGTYGANAIAYNNTDPGNICWNSNDATYVATWAPNTYHIYFSANGGSGAPSAITRTYGSDVTFPSTVPTKSGYTFGGWLYYGTGNSSSTATTTATTGTYGANAIAYNNTDPGNICWNSNDTTYVATWVPTCKTGYISVDGGTCNFNVCANKDKISGLKYGTVDGNPNYISPGWTAYGQCERKKGTWHYNQEVCASKKYCELLGYEVGTNMYIIAQKYKCWDWCGTGCTSEVNCRYCNWCGPA